MSEPEDALKRSGVRRSQGLRQVHEVVKFAQGRGMKVRGHCLVFRPRQSEMGYRGIVRACLKNPGCTAMQAWGFSEIFVDCQAFPWESRGCPPIR